MIFASILAGGFGDRVGNTDKPKQFLFLGSKPIIIHTIEKFYINNLFDGVVVTVPKQWIKYTQDLIEKYIPNSSNITVIEGGYFRNGSIINSITYLKENYSISDDDVIVTHDAVRPFVTHRIIMENIEAAKEYGVCNTVVPATDTIVESLDGDFVSNIPNRNFMYQGQTPQSFKMLEFEKLYDSLSDEEKLNLSDAAKVFTLNDEDVFLVNGEVTNIKITYAYDLKVANAILNGD